ncbi:MAG: methyltransferase domain-containing protein, partial [Pseudomonadota bacterium]
GSFDVIISNCVINLVADKKGVFRAVFDLLKPGGEFYFADIYADRRIDEALLDDPIARGECLSGALYWRDFLQLAKDVGFTDPRLFSARDVAIQNEGLQTKLAPTCFASAVYRLFRARGLEPSQEDFGASARYLGDMPFAPERFALDEHVIFEKNVETPVSANTFALLKQSRFSPYFAFNEGGDHKGAFVDGAVASPFPAVASSDAKTQSCC